MARDSLYPELASGALQTVSGSVGLHQFFTEVLSESSRRRGCEGWEVRRRLRQRLRPGFDPARERATEPGSLMSWPKPKS